MPDYEFEAGGECPGCQAGTLEWQGDQYVCMGECGGIFYAECPDCHMPESGCLCTEEEDHPDWYRNPTEDRMDREQDYDPRS